MKEGWEYKTLGEIAKDSADGPFGSNLKKEHYVSEKEVRIIQLSNIGEEGWREDNKKYTSFEHLKAISRSEVCPGDIVIAKMMPAGRAILCPNIEKKYVLSSDAVKISLKQGYNNKFVLYSINSSYFRRQVYSNVNGSGRVRTSLTKLRKCVLHIPDITTQESIVSYLDSSFQLIDKIKEKAQKSLSEAKALFQSALAEAMEPKEGWEEKTLKEIGLTQTGTTPSKANKAYYGNYIPFIRPSEINIDGIGTIEYNSEIMLSQKGIEVGRKFSKKSILMVCIGTIGKVGYTEREISCNQQINVLSPYNGYNYKYLYYAMSSSKFQKKVIEEGKSAQATLPIINKGKWEKLSLHIPPLSTQKQIVSHLDKLSSNVKQIEEKYQKMVEECDALKQAMLRDVFE